MDNELDPAIAKLLADAAGTADISPMNEGFNPAVAAQPDSIPGDEPAESADKQPLTVDLTRFKPFTLNPIFQRF